MRAEENHSRVPFPLLIAVLVTSKNMTVGQEARSPAFFPRQRSGRHGKHGGHSTYEQYPLLFFCRSDSEHVVGTPAATLPRGHYPPSHRIANTHPKPATLS